MKTLRLIILAFVLAIPARAQVHLLVTTNGALLGPVDFFTLNSNLIVSAVGGAFGGGGTGNASTNATQAWAAGFTQTFLGPVYFGTTNAVTELAGKQNADAQLDVVANLTSGTATNFLAGDGTFKQVTTNMVPGLVADILAAAAAGGGGDVTLAGTNAFTGPNSFAGTTTFNGAANLNGTTTISNLTVPGTLTATSFSIGTPLGVASGGTGAGSAAAARTNLGLVIGYDVQAYDANLAQLATVSWSSGDVPYFDGSNLTNLATTAAGRTLLAAANAAAQWDAIKSDALQSGAYDAGTWDGVTGKAVTPDQFRDVIVALPGGSNAVATVTPPLYLSNGVLTLDTDGLGGGAGGYTYLVTNVGGAFQSRADGTNWVVLSATVSSNYAPVGTGRFLEGGYGVVLTNNSGTSANTVMRIKANGALVFQDNAGGLGSGSVRTITEDFRVVRASDTLASIISVGSWVSGSAGIGIGDFGGSSPLGNSKTITNIAWNWSTNNSLEISIDCDTSTSTNSALGISVSQAFLRAEGSESGGSGTGDVVGPASSTDDNIATFDGTTGKLIQDGGTSIANLATEAEVAAGYEPLNANKYQATNSVLSTLTTLNGAALTNLNASNLASGTLSSNRLPADVAFTTAGIGTITATTVTGDGSGLTNLNGTYIASGTVAEARIDSAIARDSEVSGTYAPLASPALTGTPTVNGTNLMAEVNGKQGLLVNSSGLASALSDETGTGVAAFATAPTFTGATLNGSVVFGQSDLAAHSDLTNFVVNPTVAPYQIINGILTNALPWIRILHATNIAAGRQTTVLFCAGTNASVNVFLNPQFARNTNSVTVTTGQILPISFYGYGPDNTNVIATMGTPYTR